MSTTGTRSASARAELEHRRHGGARPPAPACRGVDHRAVGERVGERHAELDEVGAAVGVGLADRARRAPRSGSRPSGRHQRRAAVGGRERRGDPLEAPVLIASSARERLGEVLVAAAGEADQVERGRAAPALASTQATACEDSSAGMIPSSRATVGTRRAPGVGDRHVARAARCRAGGRARGRRRGSRGRPRSSAPRGSGRPRPA